MVAIEQKGACYIRMHIGEEREHEDLSIVEDVTAIAKAGQSFGGDAIATIVWRGADTQLIDIVTNGLLSFVVALDDDIRGLPEALPGIDMFCQQRLVGTALCALGALH